MDGNIYNYASGHMWNGYNEGYQPSPLELQNYMPANREDFSREQSKNSFVPPAPPYVFFNYPEEAPYLHQHQPDNFNRNQWHFPTWPKMKVRSDSMIPETPKRYAEKQFHKDCGIGMPPVHQVPSNLNIPVPGGYYSSDASEQLMVDVNRIVPLLDPQESVSAVMPGTASIRNVQDPEQSSSHRNVSRKNPAPRKWKDKPKKEDKSAKKRTRDEEKWARNIRKKARSQGESYVSVQGKTIPARSIKTVDCSKCKFSCPTRVSEDERQKLFKEYWGLPSFKEKVDYIADCIHEFAPLRPVSGRRSYSRRYTLKVNGKDERVCKEFFVTTFDISESTIVTFMGKKRKGPEAIADLRGKQTPSNKTPDATVRLIREHILSQIGLQGALNRSSSEDVKNVKRLYQHFQAECELENIKAASISVYRKVYSDMHRDKNDAPVEIPPDNVLAQSKKRKSQITEKDSSTVLDSLRDEDDDVPFESSSSELNTSSNSVPAVAEITTSTSTAALHEMSSAHELDLRQYDYQSHGQNLSTAALSDAKMCSLNIPHTVPQQQQHHRHQVRQQQQIPQHQQHSEQVMFTVPYQGVPSSSNHERGHVNNISSNHERGHVNNISSSHERGHVNNISSSHERGHVNNISSSHERGHVNNISSNHERGHVNNISSNHERGHVNNISSNHERGHVNSISSSHERGHVNNISSSHERGHVNSISSSHERGHVNNILPFIWDTNRMGSSSGVSEHDLSYCPVSYCNQNHLIQSTSSALSSSLFNYRISSSSSMSTSAVAPLPMASTSNTEVKSKSHRAPYGEVPVVKKNKDNSVAGGKIRKSKKNKPKKEAKKRSRNEDSWGRNVRKRLRFKGEAYTSVRGKQVEAKRVKEVDCSDCKFKCTSRVTVEQQEELNKHYWSLDTYQKKIEFLTKYVETYTPKRKMTGRRAFSRKYTFDVDGNEERVCKDFFKATLHISESTIATALEKSRKGPEAIVDMRGKHKPVNKTTDETLQSIRELIIYLTGMRPHRSNKNKLDPEIKDVNRLYQVYKYDSEKKGKKVASLGIFRNVLVKEFSIKSSKLKKGENSDSIPEGNGPLSVAQKTSLSSSGDSWPINIPRACPMKSKFSSLNDLLPKSIVCGDSQFGNLNIPNI